MSGMQQAQRRLVRIEDYLARRPRHRSAWADLDYSRITSDERAELEAIRAHVADAGAITVLSDDQVDRVADLIERCRAA